MKAILVIDMPEDCWLCPLHRNSWDEDDEEIMICRGTYTESHYGERPDWCPLKPLPSKADLDYYKEHFYDIPMPKGISVSLINYVRAKARNEVIDEILGEEE